MSLRPSELVVNSETRLQAANEAISSLEYTHNWEMQLKDYGGHQTSWGHGTFLYGLQTYVVNTLGYDMVYNWGSAYVSTKVFFGSGDDRVYGNIGSDKVHTGAGDDLISGGAGDDQLIGGGGDDVIYGDWGNDILYGGRGDDTFYIGDLASDLKLADVILDYGNSADALSFVTGTSKVYARKSGKDTILQDGDGPDDEFYAILKGYTDPITDLEADGVTFIEIV